MLTDSRIQPLVRMLYLAGAVVLVGQALEIGATLISGPIQPGSAEWRFRMLGMVIPRFPALVFGDVLLFAAAVRLDGRPMVQALGWIHFLLTPVLGLVLLVLAHDTLALRNTVPGRSVDIAAVRMAAPLGLTVLLTLLTGWFAVRSSRKPKWGGKKRLMTPLFTDTADSKTPDESRPGVAG